MGLFPMCLGLCTHHTTPRYTHTPIERERKERKRGKKMRREGRSRERREKALRTQTQAIRKPLEAILSLESSKQNPNYCVCM